MAFRVDQEEGDGLPEPLAEINVTPFIDVMLVLLIIFMVTAPMLAAGVPVELPKATAAQPLETARPTVVSISADGVVTVDRDPVAIGELTDYLRKHDRGKEHPIHIRADKETRYAVLAGTLDALSKAGISRYALVMSPEAAESSGSLQVK